MALEFVTVLGYPLEFIERKGLPREIYQPWEKRGINHVVLLFNTMICLTSVPILMTCYLHALESTNMSDGRSWKANRIEPRRDFVNQTCKDKVEYSSVLS